MDASGSQEQLERLRQGHAESQIKAYRTLVEATTRLHVVVDPDRLIGHALDALRTVLGPCPGQLIIVRDGEQETFSLAGRGDVAGDVSAAVFPLTQKAMESNYAVVEGQGASRSVAVPLASGTRILGALFVGPADLDARLGANHLDILSLLGRHVGLAMENGRHVRDLSVLSAASAEDAIPAGLSLRESKRHYERRLVRSRLREARGNIASAARSLHMDRGQLSRLLKKHGVDKSQFRGGR